MAEKPSFDLEAIARDLSIPQEQVAAVAQLLDDGNTPAFITRFRRQATGALNESRILDIKRRLNLQRSLAERKAIIVKSIESQGKLTDELAASIQQARTSKQLEDLYLPFKPQKQSLGQLARHRGLEPLAEEVFNGQAAETDLATRATEYIRVDKGLNSIEDVIKGIGHLIAERFADDLELRARCRDVLWKNGRITTRKIETAPEETESHESPAPAAVPAAAEAPPPPDAPTTEANASATDPSASETPVPSTEDPAAADATLADATERISSDDTQGPAPSPAPEAAANTAAQSPDAAAAKKKRRRNKKKKTHEPFRDYADFSESIPKLVPYRTLAINRAERAKSIRVKVKLDDAEYDQLVCSVLRDGHPFTEFLQKCALDAMQRLVLPSLEREIRRELTESAEQHALKVFGRNLRHLLLKPPIRGRRIVGIDPGFRYGCHAAALDEFGNYLGHCVFQVVGNEQRRAEGRKKLTELIEQHGCQIIAIGNGSACRLTEQLISDLINGELAGKNLEYVIVNEAGTNAYATSELGREELPQCEPSIRCAVSLARRVLDPLSELVKVDPAHLGIGLYQHDIKAKHLAQELDDVVASCVNYVGVDVNSASSALLAYVSGLGPLTARRFIEFRTQHGPFRNRQQFKEVTGVGDQTFVQAAGFLRVPRGDNPLDDTMIHPESYELATKILEKAGFEPSSLVIAAPPAPVPVPTTSSITHPNPKADSTVDSAPETTDTTAPIVQSDAEHTPEQKSEHETDESVSPPVANGEPALGAPQAPNLSKLRDALHHLNRAELASEWNVEPAVIGDLIYVLSHTGLDPRERLPGAVFRRGIIRLENLEPQMQLRAQVVNVVDFGVFVDIGLGESSLVHISRLSDGFVSDPHLMFAVGDTLDVWVTQIDQERRRVTLTAVRPGTQRSGARGRRPQRPSPKSASQRPPRRRGERKEYPRKPKRFDVGKRVKKAPRPVTPITKEMVEGKKPMRSFSDLAQFFDKKKDDRKDE